MTNKFEIQDKPKTPKTPKTPKVAVRNEAERISTETRRSRRVINGTEQHLQLDPRIVESLSKEGHLVWAAEDNKGHLQYLEQVGYRYVLNREAYDSREGLEPDKKVCVRYGVMDKTGKPQDQYLMIQPWNFYNEDQEALEETTNLADKQIMKQGDEVEKSYGKRIEYSHK